MSSLVLSQLILVFMLVSPANLALAETERSFSADVVPILKRYCTICHMPGSAQAGLELHPRGAYGNLVGVGSKQAALKLVSPGSPNESYLFLKITDTHSEAGGSGEKMPFEGPLLNEQMIESIRVWIASGAKDN